MNISPVNSQRDMRISLLSSAFALVLVLVIVAAGAGAVQAQETPPTGNNSSQHHWIGLQNNSTANSSEDNKGGGGLLPNIGSMGPSLDPGDWAKGFIKSIAKLAYGLSEGAIDAIHHSISHVPAPGEPGKPQTWMNPSNGQWPGIIDATKATIGIGLTITGMGIGLAFRHSDPYKRREKWKRSGMAMFWIISTFVVVPAALHAANGASLSLAPDGAYFLKSPGNFAKLGVGLSFGAILAVTQSAVIAGGFLVLWMENVLIYFGFALWPIGWAARTTNGFGKSIGDTFIYTLGVVIVTKVFQALVLYLLSQLNWGGDALTVLETLALVTAGLGFALLIFPRSMLRHANDAASFSLGMDSAERQAGQYAEKARDRVGTQLHNQYESYRDSRDEPDYSQGVNAAEKFSPSPGSSFNVSASSSESQSSSDSMNFGRSESSVDLGDSAFDTSEWEDDNWEADQDKIDYERKQDILSDYGD